MVAAEREARLESGLADLDKLVRAGLLCLDFRPDVEAEAEMRLEPEAAGAETGAGAGTGAGAEAGSEVALLGRRKWMTSIVVGPLTLAAVGVLRADSASAAEIGRRMHAKERRDEITTTQL